MITMGMVKLKRTYQEARTRECGWQESEGYYHAMATRKVRFPKCQGRTNCQSPHCEPQCGIFSYSVGGLNPQCGIYFHTVTHIVGFIFTLCTWDFPATADPIDCAHFTHAHLEAS